MIAGSNPPCASAWIKASDKWMFLFKPVLSSGCQSTCAAVEFLLSCLIKPRDSWLQLVCGYFTCHTFLSPPALPSLSSSPPSLSPSLPHHPIRPPPSQVDQSQTRRRETLPLTSNTPHTEEAVVVAVTVLLSSEHSRPGLRAERLWKLFMALYRAKILRRVCPCPVNQCHNNNIYKCHFHGMYKTK